MGKLYQKADWKTEKHVPAIDAPDTVKKGEKILITVTVGKEIPHPNTTAHHISWIKLLFWPEGEKFPYEVGNAGFLAHGASAEGADSSTIYCEPHAVFAFKTDKPGKLLATSHCNIHGFWKDKKVIGVE